MLEEGEPTNRDREEEAVVDQVLPKSMYRLRLGGGRILRAGLDTEARHAIVRLFEGDTVLVRPYRNDPLRGQITKKL